MKKKLFKIFLVVIVVGVGVLIPLNKLDALGATWCRGDMDCPEVYDACYEEEFVIAFKVSTQCYWFYECQTTLRVYCWDEETPGWYTRTAYCYSPVSAGDDCGE